MFGMGRSVAARSRHVGRDRVRQRLLPGLRRRGEERSIVEATLRVLPKRASSTNP